MIALPISKARSANPGGGLFKGPMTAVKIRPERESVKLRLPGKNAWFIILRASLVPQE